MENKEKIFRCGECGMGYKDQELARKCEAWCKEHKSCNLDIIKYAVESQKKEGGLNKTSSPPG